MDYSKLATFDFIFSLGYVTLGSVVVTMILVQIIKLILKGTSVITESMNATKKDIILSRVGRIVALIVYASFYIVDILFIKKTTLVVDITLFTSLISGSALTLCISKGFYTGLRQMSKKKNVFDKLEVAQKTIFKLQKELEQTWSDKSSTNKQSENMNSEVEEKEVLTSQEEKLKTNNKWIIKGE